MSSSNNTTEFCNITQASYEKWKEAYNNSTFKPQSEDASNTTSTQVYQKCSADGKYSGDGAVHCPSTIFPQCELMEMKNNTSYPFSVNKNTTEECQCAGFFPNSTSTSTTLNCTCINDWNANSTSLLNHTMPYLLTKNCTAELVSNDTKFNMNCTFLDCRYNAQAQALNITLQPSESCNDTSPVTFKLNITDTNTLTTTLPATSLTTNSSSVSSSVAPTPTSNNSSSAVASSTTLPTNSTTTKVTVSSSTTSTNSSSVPTSPVSANSSSSSVSTSSVGNNSSSPTPSNTSTTHNQTTSLSSALSSSAASTSSRAATTAPPTTTTLPSTTNTSQRITTVSPSSTAPKSSSSISSRSVTASSPNITSASSSKMTESTNMSTLLTSGQVTTTSSMTTPVQTSVQASVQASAQVSSTGYASPLNNGELIANPIFVFLCLIFHLFMYNRLFRKENIHT